MAISRILPIVSVPQQPPYSGPYSNSPCTGINGWSFTCLCTTMEHYAHTQKPITEPIFHKSASLVNRNYATGIKQEVWRRTSSMPRLGGLHHRYVWTRAA